LKAQGVESSFEDTYGSNKTQASSTYSFAPQKEARDFQDNYLAAVYLLNSI
jgi:hypothetical protein